MGDVFSSLVELGTDRVEHAPHGLPAVEHAPGLLVTLHVIFYLPLQLFVHFLVLDDLQHERVDV